MAQAEYRKELEDLVLTVIHEGASDMHLVVGRHPTIRVSGELIPLVKKPLLEPEDTLGLAKELLDPASLKIFLDTKGKCSVESIVCGSQCKSPAEKSQFSNG